MIFYSIWRCSNLYHQIHLSNRSTSQPSKMRMDTTRVIILCYGESLKEAIQLTLMGRVNMPLDSGAREMASILERWDLWESSKGNGILLFDNVNIIH
uniref:Uncharacterized protein n=1 Tax=Lactuca sativa TaxID=4236 RepID=A0A9R1URX3_LACSA|nr:hypothetical protein LSAT_V11C800410470 [Lactuca sativa]